MSGQGEPRPIRELPERVAAQIAAGEVIERPAAALKELVENAADAGARSIAIEITKAGRERIAVHDDGRGIAEAQLELAFLRHATSKLERVEDLSRLDSYGFRGEALPAIAAAAGRLRMVSRAAGSERAAEIVFEDGVQLPLRSAARAPGTSVELDDLFANQPARRAFLAGARAERAALLRVASDAVLARPRTSLRLTLDARTPLAHEASDAAHAGDGRRAGAGDREAALRRAVASVFSDGAAERGLWLESRSERGAIRLDGLCGPAEDGRRRRDGLRLFVNGRPIQNRSLSYAVQEAYRDWLGAGLHPLAVIRLTAPPEAVDVNIHPAKTEVKLRDQSLAFALVQRAIRDALSRDRYVSAPRVPPRAATAAAGAAAGAEAGVEAGGGPARLALPRREPRASQLAEPTLSAWRGSARAAWREPTLSAWRGSARAALPNVLPNVLPDTLPDALPDGAEAQHRPQRDESRLPPLRMVGQLHRTFIIAEGPEGLVLIDQHAAHERVLYERLLAQAGASGSNTLNTLNTLNTPNTSHGAQGTNGAASQPLLAPILLPLDAAEAESWTAAAGRLVALGFEADLFGERTLRLRALPAALGAAEAERLLRGVLAELGSDPDREAGEPERFDRAAASAACHGSVRRGAVLDAPAMRALLRDLERCEQPHTCPHGRPTLVAISADDVLRQFGRA